MNKRHKRSTHTMQFHWNAAKYHKNSQFQYQHAIEALSKHTFQSNDHILDVGCGDGKITCHVAEKAPHGLVLGIDSAPSMIAFAHKQYEHSHKNLHFKIESAEQFEYTQAFDLIISFACLHWVKNQLLFLQNAKKALKSNGKMILNLYPKHPLIWDAIDETTQQPHWDQYFRHYTNPHISYDKATYQQLAINAKLEVVSIKEEVPIAHFPTRIEAEAFIQSWLPHTEQLAAPLKAEFIHDVMDNFLQLNQGQNKHNQSIGIPFRRLDVVLIN